MAESRALAAGEHRRHPARLDREATVPYRVDAAMEPVQASVDNAAPHPVLVQANVPELRDGHHAVLSRRNLPH
jgi:hypothetical protein